MARFDIARFGSEVFRPSPRQADLLIVSGTVTKKMAPQVVRIWNQMPEPKYCIAMGACAISGGPFKQGYNVLKGIDRFIPVDIYIPGCPPRPEALLHGLMQLQEKIRGEQLTGPDAPRHRGRTPRRVPGAGIRASTISSRRKIPRSGSRPPIVRPEEPEPPAAMETRRADPRPRLLARFPGAEVAVVPNPAPGGLPASLLLGPPDARADRRIPSGTTRSSGSILLQRRPGVDWPDKPDRPGCLEVVYHLYSMARRHGPLVLRLRTANRADQVTLPSLTPVWRSCEFQEREVFDLFGVVFDGHPDLRRILMWDEFKDHPMRKDYVEPDDYEWEPTPHGAVLAKAQRHARAAAPAPRRRGPRVTASDPRPPPRTARPASAPCTTRSTATCWRCRWGRTTPRPTASSG